MTRRRITQDAEWQDDRTVVDSSGSIRVWDAQANRTTTEVEATVIVERRATELGSRFELPAGLGRSSKALSNLRTFLRSRRTAVIAAMTFLLVVAIAAASWLAARQRTKAREFERRAAAIREQQEERQEQIAERARQQALLREREAARITASLDAFVRERRERLAAVRMREAILSEIRRRPARAKAVSDAIAKERFRLEKTGADLLAANDHREALASYRRLAAIFPEESTFVDLVGILENTDRCEGGRKCR